MSLSQSLPNQGFLWKRRRRFYELRCITGGMDVDGGTGFPSLVGSRSEFDGIYWTTHVNVPLLKQWISYSNWRRPKAVAKHMVAVSANLTVLLGLLSVWNVFFPWTPARAILPYSQTLEKLAPHIQQVSMESNGKGVSIDGVALPYESGEITRNKWSAQLLPTR
ncbi:uncharacterized protein LOC131325702 [Rhododendron vialii]|uniref:uncharacterized protein LOC131325702 n=1 Tax=Rhododendron vialii TaxID=182163 RepID=UPI00265D621C|nr:uncharacterized protein LOC131325702 [Rhododendron vialii]